MPSAFTLSGVVHKITAYQVSVPPLSLTEGSYEEPAEKDMPPFKLKSGHVIRSLHKRSHNSAQLQDGRGGKGVDSTYKCTIYNSKNMQFFFFPIENGTDARF